jgi:DNA transformation protein and related proteins
MRERHEFVDYVIELLGPFGTVAAKRMFGGHGIYLDGLMFALVAREGLWLKADEMNRAEFEAARCEVFTYSRGGAQATIGFYRAPPEALESSAEMLPWARSAYAAALRANARRVAQEREREARVAARAAARAAKAPAAKSVATKAVARRKPAKRAPDGSPASQPKQPSAAAKRAAAERTPRRAARGKRARTGPTRHRRSSR